MRTVTQVSRAMQMVLVRKANDLAVQTGFMERERVLTGASFITGLVSGWQANPAASLSNLSQAVGNAGTSISRQGLAQRFDEKAVKFARGMLKASLEVMIENTGLETGLLARFESVDVVDSSIITLPNSLEEVWKGSGGFGANARVSALKLNVRWDVKSGQFHTLELSDGTQHDRRSTAHTAPVKAGSLRLADRGYFKLDDFEAIGEQGGYWLSWYKSGTELCDESGKPLDLMTWLPQQVNDRLDCVIRVGREKQLPCRLVAERVPADVVQQRHEQLHETARQNQRPVSAKALELAHWTIYLTNVPPTLLSSDELLSIGRYRWQIELLFKLWKSDLGIDQWRSQQPHRILCELYIKLIAAIVTHWLLLVGCWHNPRRSLRQAMATIRGLAWQFANSSQSHVLLAHALNCLCRALSKIDIGKARADPRAWQLIA